MKIIIPWSLLFSRLLISILFFILVYHQQTSEFRYLITFLFSFGFVSDIFDGILARKFQMDTTLMRRLDSLFDLLFWVSAVLVLYQMNFNQESFLSQQGSDYLQEILFVKRTIAIIIGIVSIEYMVTLLRFKKAPSSHNFISKFFGLALFTYFLLAFIGIHHNYFAYFVFCFGLIARFESLLIYIFLKEWTHDIPSIFHAFKINKGQDFKRSVWFHSKAS